MCALGVETDFIICARSSAVNVVVGGEAKLCISSSLLFSAALFCISAGFFTKKKLKYKYNNEIKARTTPTI